MSIIAKIRRGQGPVWGWLKTVAKCALNLHLPVNGLTRPFWKLLYQFHVLVRESWIALRRFFWNEPLFRSVCESVGSGFVMEELPYIQGRGRIVIGENVRLSGKSGFAFNNRHLETPLLKIGDRTFLGHDCSIRVAASIEIGRDCLIASRVVIADFDGHPVDADRRRNQESSAWEDIKPVRIGDDVWVGTGAIVLKGVSIGDRSIVAAHAVVSKDVAPDCIIAGNPARVVRELNGAGESISDRRGALQASLMEPLVLNPAETGAHRC